MCGCTATFPLDLAKTRMQKQKTKAGTVPLYRNPFQTVAVVARQEGIKACYSGLSVNFGFISFEKAIKLASNDFIKGKMMDEKGHVSVRPSVASHSIAQRQHHAAFTASRKTKINA
jgi:hypothetical protein